jgi:uncharacterized membrane protein
MDATVQQERARDFDRFLTFLDAIVAIAVTLLVLPLVDLVGELENDSSVLRLLQDHKAPIGAFLSFLVISQLWLIQHRMLRNVVATTDLLTGLLLAWALTVVVLPFPTALVAGPGDAGGQAITKIVYVGTMAVGSLVLGLVCLVIAHDDGLRDSAEVPDPVRAFGTSLIFLVALGVMLTLPATSYWPLLLLLASNRLIATGRVVALRVTG